MPRRQIRFQPRADSLSKYLRKDISFPEKDEIQDRFNELSPPPLDKLNKTTNIQSAVVYTAENLVW